MYKKGFLKRLSDFGIKKVILSYDTLGSIIVFFAVFYFTKGNFNPATLDSILFIFMEVSASLFAIILAGLAIVTSFTDKEFVYVWKKIGEFDNMITLFQYNLFVPIVVLIFSLFLKFVYYHSILMVLLISFFTYMLLSLIDLVNFVCRYGLQRGEFVKQLKEVEQEPKVKDDKLIIEKD